MLSAKLRKVTTFIADILPVFHKRFVNLCQITLTMRISRLIYVIAAAVALSGLASCGIPVYDSFIGTDNYYYDPILPPPAPPRPLPPPPPPRPTPPPPPPPQHHRPSQPAPPPPSQQRPPQQSQPSHQPGNRPSSPSQPQQPSQPQHKPGQRPGAAGMQNRH